MSELPNVPIPDPHLPQTEGLQIGDYRLSTIEWGRQAAWSPLWRWPCSAHDFVIFFLIVGTLSGSRSHHQRYNWSIICWILLHMFSEISRNHWGILLSSQFRMVKPLNLYNYTWQVDITTVCTWLLLVALTVIVYLLPFVTFSRFSNRFFPAVNFLQCELFNGASAAKCH